MTQSILVSLYATTALRDLLIAALVTLGASMIILVIALVIMICHVGPESREEIQVQQDP